MNREIESIAMRPLAKDLTRSLEEVRNITRDQALRDLNSYTDRMKDALRHFDGLFAEFELRCVELQMFSGYGGNTVDPLYQDLLVRVCQKFQPRPFLFFCQLCVSHGAC